MLLFAHINLTLPLEDPILKFLLILVNSKSPICWV